MMDGWIGFIFIALIAPGLLLLMAVVIGVIANWTRGTPPPDKKD